MATRGRHQKRADLQRLRCQNAQLYSRRKHDGCSFRRKGFHFYTTRSLNYIPGLKLSISGGVALVGAWLLWLTGGSHQNNCRWSVCHRAPCVPYLSHHHHPPLKYSTVPNWRTHTHTWTCRPVRTCLGGVSWGHYFPNWIKAYFWSQTFWGVVGTQILTEI